MSKRKVNHQIVYWSEFALVTEITSYPGTNCPPEVSIVFGGYEDTTTAECEAYIAGCKAWMREELQHEES